MSARLALGLAMALTVGLAGPAAAHRTQHRHHQALKPQRGIASYYRPAASGRATASGEPAKAGALTAASKTLPLGAKAKVTNVKTGKHVVVTVTDRGPFKTGRIVDVSPKAADRLDLKHDGVAPVKVQPLGTPDVKPKSAHPRGERGP